MAAPRHLKLGVIGLGADWRNVYRPALERLSARGGIAALHADARRAGEEESQQLTARHCGGVRSLLKRPLDGVVVTCAGWYGWFPVAESIRAGIDCFAAIPEKCPEAMIAALQHQAASVGCLVAPELRLRYTPATLRLRELMATEIGPIQSLEVRSLQPLPLSAGRVELELIDWCRVILAATPTSLSSRREVDADHTVRQTTELTFRGSTPSGPTAQATFSLQEHVRSNDSRTTAENPPGADSWPLEFLVKGKFGEARLEDAVHLRCRSGGRERTESLSVDRSAVAVALDHFARRLAGGLIPVPSLADLSFAARLVAQARVSRDQGRSRDLTAGDG